MLYLRGTRSFFLALVVGIITTAGCGKVAPIYKGTLHGIRIVAFNKENAKSLLSVHASPTKVLQIGQVQFENVRGFGCGFKEIEELQTLIFVTEEDGGVFVHAFDLSKNIDVKVPLGDASGFGYWLCTSNKEHQAVSMLTSNKLLLSITGSSYPDRKATRWEFTLDLEEKSVRLSATKE